MVLLGWEERIEPLFCVVMKKDILDESIDDMDSENGSSGSFVDILLELSCRTKRLSHLNNRSMTSKRFEADCKMHRRQGFVPD